LQSLFAKAINLFLLELRLEPHLFADRNQVGNNWLRVYFLQVREINVYIVDNMIHQTQLFIDLKTLELAVDLSNVKVICKNVPVANFMNFAHYFGSVVTQVLNIDSRVFSCLGYAFLESL